jgi:hypothetical protein
MKLASVSHPRGAVCVLADLPVIAAPPTPTSTAGAPSLPEAPAKLAIAGRVRMDSKYSVTLSWSDKAENEQGYRIYRDGASIATLGKNAKGFTVEPPGSAPYTYGLEACSAAGASERVTASEESCVY